jgi:hypothetical protein
LHGKATAIFILNQHIQNADAAFMRKPSAKSATRRQLARCPPSFAIAATQFFMQRNMKQLNKAA